MTEIINSNKIKLKKYLWILLIMNIVDSVTSIKFYFHMDLAAMRCLGEYLSDKTLGKNLTKIIFL